jgi:hypothetical protein
VDLVGEEAIAEFRWIVEAHRIERREGRDQGAQAIGVLASKAG